MSPAAAPRLHRQPARRPGSPGQGRPAVIDLYEVLQVDRRAEPEVVRAAYRALARKNHPDFGGDVRRMASINEAWAVLGDPARRAAYDAHACLFSQANFFPHPDSSTCKISTPVNRAVRHVILSLRGPGRERDGAGR